MKNPKTLDTKALKGLRGEKESGANMRGMLVDSLIDIFSKGVLTATKYITDEDQNKIVDMDETISGAAKDFADRIIGLGFESIDPKVIKNFRNRYACILVGLVKEKGGVGLAGSIVPAVHELENEMFPLNKSEEVF